jgi:hypothetical protein
VVLMKNMRVMTAAIATLLLLGGYFPPAGASAPVVTAASALRDLQGVDELRTLFNNDVGKVRLVLLLSPT